MDHEDLIHVHKEIATVKERIVNIESSTKTLDEKVDDIKDNHLKSIWAYMVFLEKSIGNLRWYVLGSGTILGIVLAILEVRGCG